MPHESIFIHREMPSPSALEACGVPRRYSVVVELLGQGTEGPAYALPDSRVLKLTEAADSDLYLRRLKYLSKMKFPWVVRVYAAGHVEGGNSEEGVWCVTERAYPIPPAMERVFERVDEESFARVFCPVQDPGAREYRAFIFAAKKGGHGDTGVHNVMARKDGSLVMIDPTAVRIRRGSE